MSKVQKPQDSLRKKPKEHLKYTTTTKSESGERERDYFVSSREGVVPLSGKDKDRNRISSNKKEKIKIESGKGVSEEEMKKLMGFSNFNTTKNKKVPGNTNGCVKINKPRKYRQYMNRKGGFNRPLDYIA